MGTAGISLILRVTALMKSLDTSEGQHVCHSYNAFLFYYKIPMYYIYFLSSDQFRYSEIIHFGEKEQISKKIGKEEAVLSDLLPDFKPLF